MAYEPRYTEPDSNDGRWIMTEYGGYNICIPGYYGPPSVLPNCTGYVHGRTMEIAGVYTDDLGLPNTHAVYYYDYATDDWERTSEPSLGAIGVWYSVYPYGDYQPGHVAVVEEIIDDNTIIMSESNYLPGNRFDIRTCYRDTEWRPSSGWGVVFRGFLKNPYVDVTPPEPPKNWKPIYAGLGKIALRKRGLKNVRVKWHSTTL